MSDLTLFLIGGGVFLIVGCAIGFTIVGAQIAGRGSRDGALERAKAEH